MTICLYNGTGTSVYVHSKHKSHDNNMTRIIVDLLQNYSQSITLLNIDALSLTELLQRNIY